MSSVSGDGTRRDCARRTRRPDGQNFDYVGLTSYMLPRVRPIYGMSHLLGEAVVAEVRPGDREFDVRTSCEVNGILTARTGAEVLELHVTPEAVCATRATRDNPVATEWATGSNLKR
jgi:release factor glutamine methyltransferase